MEAEIKLHKKATSAAIFFWTWNAIFALSIDLILCALSQCYNLASFPSQAATEEDQMSRRKARTTKEGKREAKDCTWG